MPSPFVRRIASFGQRRLLTAGLVVSSLLLSGYVAQQHAAAVHLQRANQLGLQRRYGSALREALRVRSGPELAPALVTAAYANEGLGRLAAASEDFARAARLEPANWYLYYRWAAVLQTLGDSGAAAVAAAQAQALNPKASPVGAAVLG